MSQRPFNHMRQNSEGGRRIDLDKRANVCSMSNETPKSLTQEAVEHLIETMVSAERARLRVWILAHFEVDGRPKPKLW